MPSKDSIKKKKYERDKKKDKVNRRKRRDKIKRVIALEKNNPCAKCKKRFIPKAMDFHHRNKKEKEFSIADAPRLGPSIERLYKEIKKCDLVCKNCHAEIEEELANMDSA